MTDLRSLATLAAARRPVTEASHLPGAFYASPDIFAREKDVIFLADWLCAGRVEEIAEPGDYMTLDVMGEPVIVARTPDHGIAAFANVCAHRGVALAAGRGRVERFRCPYHGWTYDLDGRLAGAPLMSASEAFDPTRCRLKPVAVEAWRGWIFISLATAPEPLAAFVADFEADFGLMQMERCRLFSRTEIELGCNWKFVVENLSDIYHSEVLHKKSFGAHIKTEEIDVRLKPRGGNAAFYSAAPHTPDAQPYFGKMPWLAGHPVSFARSGFLAPTLSMFCRIDEIHPVVVWPLAPDRSRIVLYQLFPEPAFAHPAFAAQAPVYRDYMVRIIEEDRAMIESLQRAMTVRSYQPGRLSTLERGIHHITNAYLARLFGAGGDGGARSATP